MTILNRMGYCASPETHERFLENAICQQEQQGYLSQLADDKFTVITVDNIDKSQRHASVREGVDRTWHGTSVMAVQPDPVNLLECGHTSGMLEATVLDNQAVEEGTTDAMLDNQADEEGTTDAMLVNQAVEEGTTDAMLDNQADEEGTTDAMLDNQEDEEGTTDAMLDNQADEEGTTDAMLDNQADESRTTDAMLDNQADEEGTTDAMLDNQEDEEGTTDAMLDNQADEEGTTDAMLDNQADEEGPTDAMLDNQADEEGTTDAMLDNQADEEGTTDAMLDNQADEEGTTDAMLDNQEDEEGTTDAMLDNQADEEGTTDAMLDNQADEEGTTDAMLDNQEDEEGTTDAMLDNQEDEEGTTDAMLDNQEDESRTTDAMLDNQEDESRTTDAMLKNLDVEPKTSADVQKDLDVEPETPWTVPANNGFTTAISAVKKPRRRLTFGLRGPSLGQSQSQDASLPIAIRQEPVSYSDFTTSLEEVNAAGRCTGDIFVYMVERYCQREYHLNATIPSLKAKLAMEGNQDVQQSSIQFLDIFDLPCDNEDTMIHVLHQIATNMGIPEKRQSLILVGDGKTYDLLWKVKKKYPSEFSWAHLYMGDWHVLKNTQEVIMKIFWDSGLKEMAQETHGNGMCATSIGLCKNFRGTHIFLMNVWEAMFQLQFDSFLKDTSQDSKDELLQEVCQVLDTLKGYEGRCFEDISETSFLVEQATLASRLKPLAQEFLSWRKQASGKDDTFRFWDRFIHEEMMTYASLYLSIRKGDWSLRCHAIKELVPLMFAFDRHMYAKLLPRHLEDIARLPAHMLTAFEKGGFTANLGGHNMSNLGLDECHEMTINKDVKAVMQECDMALPKDLERERRDSQDEQHLGNPTPMPTHDGEVPRNWQDFMSSRQNRNSLVTYLGQAFLKIAQEYAKEDKKVIVGGCYPDGKAFVVENGEVSEERRLKRIDPEADTRIFLHIDWSSAQKCLVLSKDSDVIHIGMAMPLSNKQLVVQSQWGEDSKFININHLRTSICNDPSLTIHPEEERPRLLVLLFILSGCDYTSFFRMKGKVSFLTTLLQHCEFITGDNHRPQRGSLLDSGDLGILAFFRLIGCLYYKSCKAAFLSQGHETPQQLFNSLESSAARDENVHSQFLNRIREAMFETATYEHELLPSEDALKFHWKRCMWVWKLWTSAGSPNLQIGNVEEYGWQLTETGIAVQWESNANLSKIRERVGRLSAPGCKCRGGCVDNRCRTCKKKGQFCGDNCRCYGCQNRDSSQQLLGHDLIVQELEEETANNAMNNLTDDEEEEKEEESDIEADWRSDSDNEEP
ncbi:Hypp454 [Branchiostoma lanceolatum]|uniref:Hypp454 protein n=1 Tax=Branchiostoma lanceolatum TaxID=7740 RepID=A0A8J9WDE6_BRALA|nr:Hypp454 [Branchiostoma lanceolatum]